MTADPSFIPILGPDLGFWLLGSSDRVPPEISLSLFYVPDATQ